MRYHNSEIGRWLSIDPLADKYPGWSPYNYTMDSLLKYIDPDGREINIYIKNMTKKTIDVDKVATIVKKQFENAGVKDVSTYTGIIGSIKYAVNKLFGSKNNYTVNIMSYDIKGKELGVAKGTSGNNSVTVNGGVIIKKNSNAETAIANATSHELGHKAADLQHPTNTKYITKNNPNGAYDVGTIMGTNVNSGTLGKSPREFSDKDKKKLRDKLNEK